MCLASRDIEVQAAAARHKGSGHAESSGSATGVEFSHGSPLEQLVSELRGAPKSADLDHQEGSSSSAPAAAAPAEEAPPEGEDAPAAHVIAENMVMLKKTKMCKFFAKGQCTRGDSCTFAHGKGQLQPQPDFYCTQVCFEFMTHGTCRFAASCRYAHGMEEMRQATVRKAKPGPKTRRRGDNKETKALARQLDEVRKQAEELQNQLQVLQTTVGDRRLTLTAQNFPSHGQGSRGTSSADQQTHRPSASSGLQVFAEQESATEDDAPHVPPPSSVSASPASEPHHDERARAASGTFAWSNSPPTSEDDTWPNESALVVKHTFIDVVSLHEPDHRRVASVPRNMRRSKGFFEE